MEVSGMEREMGEIDIKLALREERDRLLEILRALPEEDDKVKEAKRLINIRLATIKETLES